MTRIPEQIVREAVIKAVPEISKDFCGHCKWCRQTKGAIGWCENRPIRLADVLLAMNTLHHDGSYIISDAGFFAHFKAEGARIDKTMRVFKCSWNLRADSLSEQSPETLRFLAELLTNKEK